jgi:hypothetical protein
MTQAGTKDETKIDSAITAAANSVHKTTTNAPQVETLTQGAFPFETKNCTGGQTCIYLGERNDPLPRA